MAHGAGEASQRRKQCDPGTDLPCHGLIEHWSSRNAQDADSALRYEFYVRAAQAHERIEVEDTVVATIQFENGALGPGPLRCSSVLLLYILAP